MIGPALFVFALPILGGNVLQSLNGSVHAVWVGRFLGVTLVIAGVVRATAAVVPPLIILGLAPWGAPVPMPTCCSRRFGVDAIWWSFPVSAVVAMALSIAYYRWGNWRQARLLPTESEAAVIPAEVPAHAPSPVADPAAQCEAEAVKA